jgi:hypothetical protein
MPIAKSSRMLTYSVSCTVEDQDFVLYTCPDNCRSMMSLLFLCNAELSGSTDVSVEWYRNNGADHAHILGGKNMHASEFIQFSDGIVVLEPGDYIQITPSGNTTPHIDALCTVEEIFNPVG